MHRAAGCGSKGERGVAPTPAKGHPTLVRSPAGDDHTMWPPELRRLRFAGKRRAKGPEARSTGGAQAPTIL